jgi:hypothetical protein
MLFERRRQEPVCVTGRGCVAGDDAEGSACVASGLVAGGLPTDDAAGCVTGDDAESSVCVAGGLVTGGLPTGDGAGGVTGDDAEGSVCVAGGLVAGGLPTGGCVTGERAACADTGCVAGADAICADIGGVAGVASICTESGCVIGVDTGRCDPTALGGDALGAVAPLTLPRPAALSVLATGLTGAALLVAALLPLGVVLAAAGTLLLPGAALATPPGRTPADCR